MAIILASRLVVAQASTMHLKGCTNETRIPQQHLIPQRASEKATRSHSYSRLALMICGVISNQAPSQQAALIRLMARNLLKPLLSLSSAVDTIVCTDIEYRADALASLVQTGSQVATIFWCLDAQSTGTIPPQFSRLGHCFQHLMKVAARVVASARSSPHNLQPESVYEFIVRARPDLAILMPLAGPALTWTTQAVSAKLRSTISSRTYHVGQVSAHLSSNNVIICPDVPQPRGGSDVCMLLDDQFFVVPAALARDTFNFHHTESIVFGFKGKLLAMPDSSIPPANASARSHAPVPDGWQLAWQRCPNEAMQESWFNAHLVAMRVPRVVLSVSGTLNCLAFTRDDPMVQLANPRVYSQLQEPGCRAAAGPYPPSRDASTADASSRFAAPMLRCPEPCVSDPTLILRSFGFSCRWTCDLALLNWTVPIPCVPRWSSRRGGLPPVL